MRHDPKPNEIYRHFKGNYYKIITLAEDSETNELMVVYQALYGEGTVYVRSLSMFTSLVDKTKYPDVTQVYRFEIAENAVDPGVMEFLDAEDFETKIQIFNKLHMRLNMDMINTIAISLDLELRSQDIEECFLDIHNYLQMQAKYETNRLR